MSEEKRVDKHSVFEPGDFVNQQCKIIEKKVTDDGVLYLVRFDFADEQRKKPRKGSVRDISGIPQSDLEICRNIASKFIEYKKKYFGNYKAVRNANINDAMVEIYKVHKIDGYPYNEILDVLRTAATDSFWKTNLLTLTVLRSKCKNGLTKFEQIHKTYMRRKHEHEIVSQQTYKSLE